VCTIIWTQAALLKVQQQMPMDGYNPGLAGYESYVSHAYPFLGAFGITEAEFTRPEMLVS
jgi:hypothetical protein